MNARAWMLVGLLSLTCPGASLAMTVDLSFDVEASTGSAWAVLTDYDRLAGFVPDLELSRVRERTSNGVVLEQRARGRFLVFSRAMRVLLRCRETKGERLDFSDSLGADFEFYRGSWTLTPAGNGVRVRYELEAEPKGSAPRLVARRTMLRGARALLEHVRLEIMRRERPIR